MQVSRISNQNNYTNNFGMKPQIRNFHISEDTKKSVEKITRLSYNEILTKNQSECDKLMKERGAFKEPSKLKLWIADKYKKLGESLGLLQKEYHFYHDGC